MSVSPHDLLELARAASAGEHTACNLWCARCKATRKLRAACTPARIIALCELLRGLDTKEGPTAMTTPLDAQPEAKP